MPLGATDQARVRRFRESFERKYTGDARFGPPVREDRGDETYLMSRFPIGEKLWLEMCVRPFIPQLRAGVMTDDRWTSEDLETVIEDSGDTMSEFVEMGFEEAGLTWKNPVVEHYRDQGKYFYFATALDLARLEQIDDPDVSDKLCRMFEGYYEAFRPAIEKAARAE